MKCKSFLEKAFLSAAAFAVVAGISPALAQAPAATSMERKDSMKPGMSMEKGAAMKPGMTGTAAGGEMQASMMGMMKNMESMKSTGDTDHDFAQMMKMHHQGAIDMAQVELKSGKDASLKAMARKIIAAQKKEIEEFDHWLARHK